VPGGWLSEAQRRVTGNPGLEVMARRSFTLEHAIDDVWQAIAAPMHWQADAFHNAITDMQDAGGIGTHFEMLHTNHPIIPWPMPDQRFRGVVVAWEPPRRQSIAELNTDSSAGSKRTPDHQQTIELEPLGPARTRLTYTVATVRMEGISEVTRFFFRPWARFQLRRAIGKKLVHIRQDLAAAG
jgi:hypothetical protein